MLREMLIGAGVAALLALGAWALFCAWARRARAGARVGPGGTLPTGALRARELGLHEYAEKLNQLPRELYSFELVRAPRHEVRDFMYGQVAGKRIVSVTLVRKLAGGDDEASVYCAELALEVPHLALCPPPLLERFRQTAWEALESAPDERFRAAFHVFAPKKAALAILKPHVREIMLRHRGWAFELFYKHAVLVAPKKLRGGDARAAMEAVAQIAELVG